VTAILGTVVAVTVVAAVTVLGWHGTLDGQTVAGLFGALIGGGAGAAYLGPKIRSPAGKGGSA
jgi:hypothetical protein